MGKPKRRQSALERSAREFARKWGREGGLKRARRLSPERRSEIARTALAARRAKEKGRKLKK